MKKQSQHSLFSLAANPQDGGNEDYRKVAAWFLGPKAENIELFLDLLQKSIREHAELRKNYYPDEEAYIDEEVKESNQYKEMCAVLTDKRKVLSDKLKNSVPFFSQRYQAHMNWDTLMAGNLGYMTAMLYNQNNVATEASPVTSVLEKEVGEQLCTLLGFEREKSWGHITADGTIANIEAMWAARNLKVYPLAIKEMLSHHPEVKKAHDTLKVNVFEETDRIEKLLVECSDWQLLNIHMDEALDLMERIQSICGISADRLNGLLKQYLLATKGIAYYAKKIPEFANMKVFVPATHHYSWPKAGTLLGIGQENVIGIPVDAYCKMDTNLLKQALSECIKNKHPVLMVVAVIGSTAEGAVDDVVNISRIKEESADSGLTFNLHCDAAWGGYLRSMLIEPKAEVDVLKAHFVPSLPLSYYAIEQYDNIRLADTITIDPHKAGYIPYAAGALCYRNKQLRYLITFNAAYIHSDADTNMGIYGLEGSKPGASAAAVWLAHETVPLDRSGYGQILGECSYSAKLYYCHWMSLSGEIDLQAKGITGQYAFHILPLIQLPDQIESKNPAVASFYSKKEMMEYIAGHIIYKDAEEISKDPRAMMLLQNVGTDVLMNTFFVNFSKDGIMNTDYRLMNQLNENLFEIFSITTETKELERPKYVLMMNTLSSSQYGSAFHHVVKEWELNVEENYDLNVLVNTVLQPWPNTSMFVKNVMETFKEGIAVALKKLLTEEK